LDLDEERRWPWWEDEELEAEVWREVFKTLVVADDLDAADLDIIMA